MIFFWCVFCSVDFFFPRKGSFRRSQARLENLLRFSSLVDNGTMGGINTPLIVGRDNAKPILGGRVRPGRWEDFANSLEPFVQSLCGANCKLE